MDVLQISDLHLGPEDVPANRVAWTHARRLAQSLSERAEPDRLVIVITGDLSDHGHTTPEELDDAKRWLHTLPGTVLVVPGNHDVGNFLASIAQPTVNDAALGQWDERFGSDRFSHVGDGHRLIGLNSMLWGSGFDREVEQFDWLAAQLDEAEAMGQAVWLFQHAPLFLRQPDEVREDREHYWCPEASARDRVLALIDRPCVKGVSNGHVHRQFDLEHDGRLYRSCPALSGTHTDADYFLPGERVAGHALSSFALDGTDIKTGWEPSGVTIGVVRRPG